jgi:hypothetical protein
MISPRSATPLMEQKPNRPNKRNVTVVGNAGLKMVNAAYPKQATAAIVIPAIHF